MSRFAALIALALLGCAAGPSVTADAPPARPNIILIMADDVGVEAFGSYGGRSYETPTLDALASAGVRFTACHSQPLCTPSRVKIMTGRSNVRNYVRFGIFDPEERTFAHVLREAGYATAVAGKWQLYGSSRDGKTSGGGARPEQAGFDEYCLWQVERIGSRYWKPLIMRNGVRLETGDHDYGPDRFRDFINDFVTRHRDEPFFVYYPMALVHSPFEPTPASADRASKDRQRNFADMVQAMDRIVGQIDAHLGTLGLRENTILVFTSDNGTHKRIRSRTDDGVVAGGKGETLDRGTHVPLIVSWPGTAAPRVCDDLIDFSDVLPTLAGAARVDLGAAPIDGRSFLPQIRGEPGTPRESIYCYYNPRPGQAKFPEVRFARDHRWKLYGDGRLFEVATDPEEALPVPADTSPEAAAAHTRLRSVLDGFPVTGEKIGAGREKNRNSRGR